MTSAQVAHELPSLSERLLAPAFLITLLLLGGATTGAFLVNGLLQVIAGGVIIFCLFDARGYLSLRGGALIAIAMSAIALCAAQLIPLPPEFWTSLPGRSEVAESYAAASMSLPPLPLSLAPIESLFGLGKLLPPLAAICVFARSSPAYIGSVLVWSIVLVVAATVLLGVSQVVSGGNQELYLHAFTNRGLAVGLMANANHQATLLLMSLPFGIALFAASLERGELEGDGAGRHVVIAGLCCMAILGIALTSSLAALIFLPITLLCSFLGSFKRKLGRISVFALFAGATSLGVLAAIVIASPVFSSLGLPDWAAAEESRRDTYERTIEIIGETFPVGTGVGSFEALYPRYEDSAAVTNVYMNHAHSDMLELTLELGLPGLILMAAVLAWYFTTAFRIWRTNGGTGTRLRRAASVAFLIALLHSFIDYPMRTTTIAGFAAACLGIMASSSRRRDADAVDGNPSVAADGPKGRHVII